MLVLESVTKRDLGVNIWKAVISPLRTSSSFQIYQYNSPLCVLYFPVIIEFLLKNNIQLINNAAKPSNDRNAVFKSS